MIILVGNKKDLDAEREVTFLEASRFAQENGTLSYVSEIICFPNETSTRLYMIIFLHQLTKLQTYQVKCILREIPEVIRSFLTLTRIKAEFSHILQQTS